MVGNTVDDFGSVVSRIDMNAEGACAEGHIDDIDDSLCHIRYISVRCRSQLEAFHDLLSQIDCRSRFVRFQARLVLWRSAAYCVTGRRSKQLNYAPAYEHRATPSGSLRYSLVPCRSLWPCRDRATTRCNWIDIKRCRRTSVGTKRYRVSSLIVPLTSPEFEVLKFQSAHGVSRYSSNRQCSTSGSPLIQELHSHLLGCISSFIGSYSPHERPARPISKAKPSGWATRSTFCSREPDRQSAYIPSEGDSSRTKGES